MRTLLLIVMATSCVLAQDDAGGTVVAPPSVHPDRTVTLRWSAPKGSRVALLIRGAAGEPKPPTKSARGVWYFEIVSTPPRYDQVQDVPHGAIHIRTYQSAMRKETRQLYVY